MYRIWHQIRGLTNPQLRDSQCGARPIQNRLLAPYASGCGQRMWPKAPGAPPWGAPGGAPGPRAPGGPQAPQSNQGPRALEEAPPPKGAQGAQGPKGSPGSPGPQVWRGMARPPKCNCGPMANIFKPPSGVSGPEEQTSEPEVGCLGSGARFPNVQASSRQLYFKNLLKLRPGSRPQLPKFSEF